MRLAEGLGCAALGCFALAWLLAVRRRLPGAWDWRGRTANALEPAHALFAALAYVLLPAAVAGWFPPRPAAGTGQPDLLLGVRALAMACVAAPVLVGFLATAGLPLRALGIHARKALRAAGIGIAEFLAWAPLAFLALHVAQSLVLRPDTHPYAAMLKDPAIPAWSKWWIAVAAIVTTPLWEELVFRGVLQQTLARRLPAWLAIGLTALAFAGVHSTWPEQFPLFLIGVMFGVAFQRTGSLWAPFAAHAALNGFSVVQALRGAG